VKERLKQLLDGRQKRYISDTSRIPAAVMLPLYQREGQDYLVFIKRTEEVREHKGQISFPGGSREDVDVSLLDTAVRESCEEIGLSPADIEVLGELDDEVTTTSNYVVTPFVGKIPWPYDFVMNEVEVDEIIEVPLSELLADGCLQPDTEILNGRVVSSYAYHWQGRIIWGATARILNHFLDFYRLVIDAG
jgi:8-oxo-dGTP pyrophosphatase MutT (NUDIX family)